MVRGRVSGGCRIGIRQVVQQRYSACQRVTAGRRYDASGARATGRPVTGRGSRISCATAAAARPGQRTEPRVQAAARADRICCRRVGAGQSTKRVVGGIGEDPAAARCAGA